MPINFTLLESVTRRLAETVLTPHRDLPLVPVGESGELQLLEPAEARPGRWTRFKAALTGLPLIGRLRTLRRARAAVAAAEASARQHGTLYEEARRYRATFLGQLAQHFGPAISEEALREVGPAAVLTANSLDGILTKATRLGHAYCVYNTQKLTEQVRLECRQAGIDDAGWLQFCNLYAAAWATANIEHCFANTFYPHEFGAACRKAIEACQALAKSKGMEALPWSSTAAHELEQTPLAQKRQVAQRLIADLERLLNDWTNDSNIRQRHPRRAADSEDVRSDGQLVSWLCVHADPPQKGVAATAQRFSEEKIQRGYEALAAVRRQLVADLRQLTGEAQWDEDRAAQLLRRVLNAPRLQTAGQGLPACQQRLREAALRLHFRESARMWRADRPAPRPSHIRPEMEAMFENQALEQQENEFARGLPPAGESLPPHYDPQMMQSLFTELAPQSEQLEQQHEQTLWAIKVSSTLNDAQKRLLMFKGPPIAQQLYWLNRHQAAHSAEAVPAAHEPMLYQHYMEEYLKVADVIARCLPQIQQAVAANDPVAIFDRMTQIDAALQSGLKALGVGPGSLDLKNNDYQRDSLERDVFLLCVRLVLAKPAEPVGDPGESSGSGQGPRLIGRSDLVFPDAVSHFKDLCRQFSGHRRLSALYALLEHEVTAPQLGAGSRPRRPITGSIRPNAGYLPDSRPEFLARVLVGLPGPGNSHTLVDDPVGRPGVAQHYVSGHFDLEPIEQAVLAVPPGPHQPLSNMLSGILYARQLPDGTHTGGADIILNGRRLTAGTVGADETLDTVAGTLAMEFSQEFDATQQDEEAFKWAIGGLLSSRRLEEFCAAVDRAAFHPPLVMSHQRSVHEAWRNEDGSWTVRSTHVARPLTQGGRHTFSERAPPITAPIPLHPDGAVLYTLIHKVRPPAAEGAPAPVELVGCHTVFAF